ncbi:uncharacterized protein N7484_007599 [Penicillium longicatenatum]|uniref:uncharacterized protein n=1 Tax=Penicillium longicatenatum TaxID=1561947 RepID=UPI002546DBD2|nr:uncharacterized protein N7484_007599 [Penicillium longicatenatum]KAJ5639737.1 hypothetical protein N7484_007599 [Penicillium longicatenatum]
MARRTSRLAASATPALADVPATHDTPDDTMSLDIPEQLLTPEASRSETSSNNENASTEEQPTQRRRSTRVVRASLRATEALENTPGKKDESTTSSSQAYVDSLAKAKRSRSGLRHSIAVMQSSLRTDSALPTDDTLIEDHSMAPDTPVSKSSQELQPEDMNTSLQQRTLRKRVERALVQDEESATAKSNPKNDSRQPLRRSTRASLLGKASEFMERANSVLGKRSRDLGDKGKEVGRRASLRPRHIAPTKEEGPASVAEPAAKKRRVSESDLSNLKSKDETPSEESTAPPVVKYKPKVWMKHGLYSGQEASNSPPKQRKSKNSGKTSLDITRRRRHLPMPIFGGLRLIKTERDYLLPFDIFSPLPQGQPKPDEWRKTNKNVFVGDAASEWKANKKVELSTCMCDEDTGCDENCQNRYMFYECDNGNCRLGAECGNRNFSELKNRTKAGGKYNIGVEVIKTEDRGYGVRSNRSFEPNQIIVEYTGEIITQFECERRMRNVYKNNECYYLMYFDQNMIIDATRGSIARFVNHSCQPNCRMEKWTVGGKPRMALFAGDRGIMTGDELSYDYNFDPYSNKNVQQCRCGAPNCRGILGPRPKDKDQRAKAEAANVKVAKTGGTKRKRATAAGTGAQTKKRKLLSAKSIKVGVKKAVNKVTTARGKTTTKKTTTTTARGQTKTKTLEKKTVKLPTVKAASRVKAAIRAPQRKTTSAKAKAATSPAKKTNQLKRPSAETKKQILANAANGSRSPTKSPAKPPAKGKAPKAEKKSPRKPVARKAPTKAPVNVKMPTLKAKGSAKSPGKTAQGKKSLGSSVKSAARSVAQIVKGRH